MDFTHGYGNVLPMSCKLPLPLPLTESIAQLETDRQTLRQLVRQVMMQAGAGTGSHLEAGPAPWPSAAGLAGGDTAACSHSHTASHI